MNEKKIGDVTHYYNNLHVATVKITDGELHVGDMIHVEGHTSDFTQKIKSMELDHAPVEVAKEGDIVGIEIKEYVREHDNVYIVH
jgi:translation elongation factor EF-1alpha